MQLTDRHMIKKTHPNWAECDQLAFCSKNLFNYANYQIRQSFIWQGKFIPYATLASEIKESEPYRSLPSKVAQQTLKRLDESWRSFFAALTEWKENPSKFFGRPKLPKYKDKEKGRSVVTYTTQAISRKWLKKGWIHLSQTNIFVKVIHTNLACVRLVPKCDHYVIEVVYHQEEKDYELDQSRIASIDLGLNNLCTITYNQPELNPVLINGKPLKSINHRFNKKKASLQSQLPKSEKTSHKIRNLTNKRNRRIDHYLHHCSRWLIDDLVSKNIGTLVIGQNKGWKNGINIGDQNNQNFVGIPHSRLLEQIKYKAQLVGIKVVLQEESFTSKASFEDGDSIPTYHPQETNQYKFSGKRIKRGLYRTGKGCLVNADVNGSLNILRKAFPKACEGIKVSVVKPFRVTPCYV